MDFDGMVGENLQIDYKADGNTIKAYRLLDTQTNLFNSQLLLKILYQLLELVPINLKVCSSLLVHLFIYVNMMSMSYVSPILRRLCFYIF